MEWVADPGIPTARWEPLGDVDPRSERRLSGIRWKHVEPIPNHEVELPVWPLFQSER